MSNYEHGGARLNAGRKALPKSEKKAQVWLFIRNADIKALGGKAKVREIAMYAIDSKLGKTEGAILAKQLVRGGK